MGASLTRRLARTTRSPFQIDEARKAWQILPAKPAPRQ
ncbi:hypothetical protein LVY75_34990 (plasmid) [Sinorhizobium sp. B11]